MQTGQTTNGFTVICPKLNFNLWLSSLVSQQCQKSTWQTSFSYPAYPYIQCLLNALGCLRAEWWNCEFVHVCLFFYYFAMFWLQKIAWIYNGPVKSELFKEIEMMFVLVLELGSYLWFPNYIKNICKCRVSLSVLKESRFCVLFLCLQSNDCLSDCVLVLMAYSVSLKWK